MVPKDRYKKDKRTLAKKIEKKYLKKLNRQSNNLKAGIQTGFEKTTFIELMNLAVRNVKILTPDSADTRQGISFLVKKNNSTFLKNSQKNLISRKLQGFESSHLEARLAILEKTDDTQLQGWELQVFKYIL